MRTSGFAPYLIYFFPKLYSELLYLFPLPLLGLMPCNVLMLLI